MVLYGILSQLYGFSVCSYIICNTEYDSDDANNADVIYHDFKFYCFVL